MTFKAQRSNPAGFNLSKSKAALLRGLISPVEALEQRVMLSVGISVFIGPIDAPGTEWDYLITTAKGQTATFRRRVIGPTTFNGIPCIEIDEGSKLQAKSFVGYDSQGNFVEYADTSLFGTTTSTDVYSPAKIDLPNQVSAGVPYSLSVTDTNTSTDSSGNVIGSPTTSQHTEQTTLLSESTAPVAVPLNTYDAYEITSVSKDTTDNGDGTNTVETTTVNAWYVDGIGFVKETDSNGNSYGLTAFNSTQDHLVFSQQPPMKSPAGKPIAPAVTVTAEDPNNNPDPNASGTVTLSLDSFLRAGTGTLSGMTAPLVGGVATFSDLSISTDGNYQLHATDTGDDTPADSNEFRIGNTSLQVEIVSRAPGGTVGVKTGNVILYSVLVTPLLGETLQDQDLVVTLPNGFVPKGITAGGQPGVNTIEWKISTRVYNFDITVPKASAMGGIKNIVVSADDNVTYTDGTTDEGTATNSVKIAIDNGLEFLQNPGNLAAGQTFTPALTVAVRDIYRQTDTNSTDMIRLSVKKGPGSLSGTVTAAAVNGVATFSDLSIVQRAGDYTLMAKDLTNSKIAAGTSNPFALVGLKTITGAVGSQKQTSSDDGLTISASNTVAVTQSTGTMELTAAGLSDNSTAVRGGIKWAEVRNTDDVATGGDPMITPSSSNPLSASVNLNDAMGSFNLICYFDTNSNGTYDDGEELRVFHLADVGIVVQSGAIVPSNASFVGKDFSDGKSGVVSGSFSGNHWAITSSETVQVIGGGSDGMIGVNKVRVGWLQNGVSDSFAVTYQDGSIKKEKLKAGVFPLLDATYNFGGYSLFLLPQDAQNPPPRTPGPIRDPAVGADPNGGEDRTVATGDSPTVTMPTMNHKSPAVSTSGSNDFAEYLTAYSRDFSDSYSAYDKVTWSAAFVFTRSSDGIWADAGSSVTDSESNFGGGKLLDILDVATSGPLFNQVAIVR